MSINSEYTIRQEQPADFSAVENLTREAFWNVYRPGCLEHYVLHCYRSNPGFIPELSLVLEKDGEILAHVMFAWSEILVDTGEHLRMMTFGPISVRPDMQRKGLGKMLLDYALERARQMGAGCIAMCGNIQFYGKCGFVTATSKGIRYADDPDGDAPYFLIKELTPGFLDGIRGSYRDPEAYFVNEADADEFDKQFPPKEKKVLPGQLG
ncbi:putative N-acetyltransferase YhbS [Fibrobacter sp. UWR4]|uniref:GNAT family N-acetyltransferase n=2 Tax=unclassified Fibrobacter TaxID=2634177 RepID=UPI000D6D56AA|nr:N-acetyltransferase [Fibrobacter sp. UWR4]PWJ63342.1 putative N-acetyltransferase YhbS [Fibrobacter sp. UWR4]